MIEYEDNGDSYEELQRVYANDIIDIRLYCSSPGCNKYIKGKEHYNGYFIAETGEDCDLRNQEYRCNHHKKGN